MEGAIVSEEKGEVGIKADLIDRDVRYKRRKQSEADFPPRLEGEGEEEDDRGLESKGQEARDEVPHDEGGIPGEGRGKIGSKREGKGDADARVKKALVHSLDGSGLQKEGDEGENQKEEIDILR